MGPTNTSAAADDDDDDDAVAAVASFIPGGTELLLLLLLLLPPAVDEANALNRLKGNERVNSISISTQAVICGNRRNRGGLSHLKGKGTASSISISHGLRARLNHHPLATKLISGRQLLPPLLPPTPPCAATNNASLQYRHRVDIIWV